MKSRLFRNFSWSLAGNVVYAASQWGMLVSMAKMGSVMMVGQFTLALAIASPIILFTNMSLRNLQASDAAERFSFGDYFLVRLGTAMVGILLISFVTLLGRYDVELGLVILLMGVAKGVEALSDIAYGLMQRHESMHYVGRSLIIKGPLSLFALSLGIYFFHSLLIGMLFLVAVYLLRLLTYDLPNALRLAPLKLKVKWETVREIVRKSLPLGFVALFMSFNANIPRYFIEHTHGLEMLGYFSAMTYTMVAGTTVINAMGLSVIAPLANYYSEKNMLLFKHLLTRLLAGALLLGLAGIAVVAFFGEPLLTFLYQAEYARFQSVFLLIMVGAGIGYLNSFLGNSLTAAQMFKEDLWLSSFSIALNVAANAFLVPLGGLEGAAYALIIAASGKLLGGLYLQVKIFRSLAEKKLQVGGAS